MLYYAFVKICKFNIFCSTLQMKGQWESNINVWFRFMYSQKWNCWLFPKQNYKVLSPNPTLIYQDRSVYFAAAKYADQSWEYINHSQTQECRDWDWGRGAPFRYSVLEKICGQVIFLYILDSVTKVFQNIPSNVMPPEKCCYCFACAVL